MTDRPARSGAALVTGGGKRIGRAIALELARAGFDVAIHYRSSEDAAGAVADEVRALGRKAATVKADLAVEAQARTLVADAARAIGGPLAVLVNNASVFE
ncbi:MAG TPA: SDR family NAD(P)-dependent oxidoreductase, partial [Brevundimonas sp.]|nr:SDR family NAD(P)-dependent oxidoreductase [Brevundimonas sp.]